MSPSKPLSYEPLKSVLTHIDANKRFEISQKMPTSRKMEKLVPLKIDKLAFSAYNFQLTVNQTDYYVSDFEEEANKKLPDYKRLLLRSPEYFFLIRDGIITEHVKCNKEQLEHAPIYLMRSFFGGRSDTILVKHLSFDASHILEFPQNVKFQIRHLTIQKGIRNALRKLSAVLTESSFPLQSLEIFVDLSTEEEFRDEIVQQARKVIVHNPFSDSKIGAANWNFLPTDTHFEFTQGLAPDDFVALIRHWRTFEAAPGRRCSVRLSCERFGIETMLKIQKLFDVVQKNGVNIIPINQSSEVHVSLREYNGPQDIDYPPTSILLLEVVEKM